jgi:hypothetical protein
MMENSRVAVTYPIREIKSGSKGIQIRIENSHWSDEILLEELCTTRF